MPTTLVFRTPVGAVSIPVGSFEALGSGSAAVDVLIYGYTP